MKSTFLQVAVDAPIDHLLTYLEPILSCPEKSINSEGDALPPLLLGSSVTVPLGKRSCKAVVIDSTSEPGPYKLRPIKNVDEGRPVIPEKILQWHQWVAKYYVHPIGQVVSMAFPPLKKSSRPRKSKKQAVVPNLKPDQAPQLTQEQVDCCKSIKTQKGFGAHLLFGVTGSGKTEVYLDLIHDTIKRGQQALILVPEISLTPQLIHRFARRFPEQVAVLHSHLTGREKTDQWWSIVEQKKKILVGARSALFCPLKNLGIIIIDEEHETSFKQDETLKYHARDAAIMLAKILDCPIVLGSATPSIETWNNALSGRYKLHTMKNRVSNRKLPQIQIVDLRTEKQHKKLAHTPTALPFWLSLDLYNEMVLTLKNSRQVALFLNRRGIAQNTLCPECGYTFECPNCAVGLTLHGKHHLVCHYCNYAIALPHRCPSCKEGEPTPLGLGTELIESEIEGLFPEARVARADRDEIHSREGLELLISNMENREIDILIGTQMIAKGLDFEHLTLVGLILADIGMNMPDFRSSEKSFQLLTQVSGRSGRHAPEGGKVIIQTFNPSSPSIQYTLEADYSGFAEQELENRKALNYPPFGKIASFRLSGSNESHVQLAADRLGHRARALIEKYSVYTSVQILGPAQSPLYKIRNRFRYHALVKSTSAQTLNSFCRQILGPSKWLPPGTKIQIDIDPINML